MKEIRFSESSPALYDNRPDVKIEQRSRQQVCWERNDPKLSVIKKGNHALEKNPKENGNGAAQYAGQYQNLHVDADLVLGK
ncbi:MAG: hypothetical protein EOO01_03285 [Chitinophagaceae bacterium]|nr:MAG: hypothetical protein EOO01_03285 [Chitinophagaceae bacterium]